MTASPPIQILSARTLFALMAGLGLYAGVALAHPHLLLLGVGSLAVLVVAAWQASRQVREVRVQRLHPGRAFEGNAVFVRILIQNTRGRALSLMLVEDSFPPGDVWRVRYLVEHALHEGEQLEIQFRGECNHHRGLYALGPVRLQAYDALGLVKREVVTETMTNILVYPTTVDLHAIRLLADGTIAHVGLDLLPRAGESTDFRGLRPWRSGDPPNAIHWRTTARTGELHTKEFEDLVTTHVTIFLDLGRLGLTGIGDQTSVEYAIKAATSIAERAIARSHLVQLFTIGESMLHTPAGSGQRHLLIVLDHLALLKPSGNSHFLPTVSDQLAFLKPGGTIVLLMSASTADVDALQMLCRRALQRRLLPVVVLVDDRAFIKLFHEQEVLHGSGPTLEDLARLLVLEGVRVHIITRARTPEEALVQGLDSEVLVT